MLPSLLHSALPRGTLAASSYPILSPPLPGPFPILHFRTPHPLATLSLSITLSTPSIMFFPLIVSFINVLEPYTRFIIHDISFFPSRLYLFTFAVLGIIHHDIFSSMAIRYSSFSRFSYLSEYIDCAGGIHREVLRAG